MIDNCVFSDAQVITANATSVASTNVVDLGALVGDRGTALTQFGPDNGEIWLVVSIGAVQPSAGTAIYLELQDCATEGGTYKDTGIGIAAGNAIPIATLTPGYPILITPLMPSLRRFVRINYTTTGDWSTSLGTFNARLQHGAQSNTVTPHRV